MLSNFCLFIRVASVMGGRMGSNLLTEGGGKGAGCVFILLIILEAALDKFTININKLIINTTVNICSVACH